jgi:nucleoside phosphorylase
MSLASVGANLCIVCALQEEALPLIEKYNLKRIVTKSPYSQFPVYESSADEIKVKLIISGIGKIRSAIATSLILTDSNSLYTHCVNFGAAGTDAKHISQGELLLIRGVYDLGSSRRWYTDIFHERVCEEAFLYTSDTIVTNKVLEKWSANGCFLNESLSADSEWKEIKVFDMEGSGFIEGALHALPPENCTLIKLVSDHIDSDEKGILHNLKQFKAHVRKLIEEKIDTVVEIIAVRQKYIRKERGNFALIETYSNTIKNAYTLTESEGIILRQILNYCSLKKEKDNPEESFQTFAEKITETLDTAYKKNRDKGKRFSIAEFQKELLKLYV